MESPNPNSSKNSSASPKETNSPIKNSKGPTKDAPETALEVLEELKVGKNEIGRGDSKVVAANSSMVEVTGVELNDNQAIHLKKRKNNIEVKGFDPTKNPICPRCNREFFTYNAAIEHLRINPNCASTGTSKASQPDLNKGANEVQPMEIGSSNAAAAPPKPAERKGCGFDLNELPPPEKDDE
ncbi:hypothetical protein TSUD_223710 [Trifolium subterraneum]|uniref:Uncharacterized protein n=1 Tax=Trifolium subterraneum TaxID=3900 RepID=A0A2Z6N1G0_TRISU|nr:hypothetical protein TSUD_223710 [Trifolium subterraneum]